MKNYADRLLQAIEAKKSPCVVGLDPRLDLIPTFIVPDAAGRPQSERIRDTIGRFNRAIIQAVSPVVPAVKLQVAFYEQYGVPGLEAFVDTIHFAKECGLIVIVDAKRNDISSTAEAYANAFLGRSSIFGELQPIFDVDCITVSPFLGRDSLLPFVDACATYGKGIFVLVKTSNPGSVDFQDQTVLTTKEPIFRGLAKMVHDLGQGVVGESGYSSIGAVVGATFPQEAKELRQIMSRAIILVPGYGAQGGTAEGAAACFNSDRRGAVVNASRSIIYSNYRPDISADDFHKIVRDNAEKMRNDVVHALPSAMAATQ